jgi:uronate dehydrogenase
VEADWETVLQANIIGAYNLFEAARRQGVQRVVFATTNHVIGFYRRSQRIDHQVPPRPDSRYGVSKAFGEALGRLYADKHGLRVFNIRIGNVGDRPLDRRRLSIWISPRDLLKLVRIGLEHPEIHYEVVYGVSENDRTWWDNANAYRLGYQPEGESEPFAPEVLANEPPVTDEVAELFQGGAFCSAEFTGDPERID